MTQKPALAPEFEPVLQQLAQVPAIPTLSVDAARAMWDQFSFGEEEELETVRDLEVGGAVAPLPARLYRPKGDVAGLIVYYHGGGWVLGSLTSHDKCLRGLARRSACAILAIDYRLAPEHPFPAGLDDCYAALEWAAAHRADLGLSGLPLIIGGDSAGGNLTASVAILARDRKGPDIALQLLIYPNTDNAEDWPSYQERGTGGLLTAADMIWFRNHYMPEGTDRKDARASVYRAETLNGLPPAIYVTAEFDPLRDEGKAYARRLADATVPVVHLHYEDLPHGFITFYQMSPRSGQALDEIAHRLRSMIEETCAA